MDSDRPSLTRTNPVENDGSGHGASDDDGEGTDDSDDGNDGDSTDGTDGDVDRWVILNPVSGDGTHADRVHRLAADRGFRVLETAGDGDAARYAREAVAENVRELAVCGGDGTLQEVLAGLEESGALRPHTDDGTADDGTADGASDGGETPDGGRTANTIEADPSTENAPILSVIPVGTANIFATDMGITGIDEGFDVLDTGEARYLDVGLADGEPFMKSCIAGLTADTSSATSDDLKERFGSLAFVITGVKRAAKFDPLDVEIEVDPRRVEDADVNVDAADEDENTDDSWVWSGEALCLVVGNARRYAGEIGQANVEDGLLDITLVEEMPPGSVVTEAVVRQLIGHETEHVTRLKASHLAVEATGDDEIEFSLDGEIASHDHLSLTVRERAVPIRVGPTYEPDPDDP